MLIRILGHYVPALREPLPRSVDRRARRLASYERAMTLAREGWSLTAIGRTVGLSRPTVRRYAQAAAFPEWAPQRTRLGGGTAHGASLRRRWTEGCCDATTLWHELRERGYGESLHTMQRAVAGSYSENPMVLHYQFDAADRRGVDATRQSAGVMGL